MTGLVGLTAGKTVVNVAIRWIPFFLPTLGRAFGASTAQLTSVIGIGETAGFLSAAVGKWLDRGKERLVMTAGMGLVGLSTMLAIVGSFPIFVVAQFVLMLGVSLYTVAGHAYISRHVRFEHRGRSIGIFEVSWALGLFIGAPTAAVLIDGFSWRAPFIAVGLLAFVSCAVLLVTGDPSLAPIAPSSDEPKVRLTKNAWLAVAASAGIALAGLSTIVVIGTWMEETLGISIDGIGLVAMGFGAVELLSSSSSAIFSDRLGKNRSTRAALVLLLVGLTIMWLSGATAVLAIAGVAMFFLGFEYAIVTSFSVVSEAMPSARGRVLSINMAAGTMARGVGSVASGFLFEGFGIGGTAVLAGSGALLALIALVQVEGV